MDTCETPPAAQVHEHSTAAHGTRTPPHLSGCTRALRPIPASLPARLSSAARRGIAPLCAPGIGSASAAQRGGSARSTAQHCCFQPSWGTLPGQLCPSRLHEAAKTQHKALLCTVSFQARYLNAPRPGQRSPGRPRARPQSSAVTRSCAPGAASGTRRICLRSSQSAELRRARTSGTSPRPPGPRRRSRTHRTAATSRCPASAPRGPAAVTRGASSAAPGPARAAATPTTPSLPAASGGGGAAPSSRLMAEAAVGAPRRAGLPCRCGAEPSGCSERGGIEPPVSPAAGPALPWEITALGAGTGLTAPPSSRDAGQKASAVSRAMRRTLGVESLQVPSPQAVCMRCFISRFVRGLATKHQSARVCWRLRAAF